MGIEWSDRQQLNSQHQAIYEINQIYYAQHQQQKKKCA